MQKPPSEGIMQVRMIPLTLQEDYVLSHYVFSPLCPQCPCQEVTCPKKTHLARPSPERVLLCLDLVSPKLCVK